MGALITFWEDVKHVLLVMIFDTIPADFLTALFLIKAIVDNVILITSSDLMENVSIKMNFVGNMMTMDFVWNVLQNIF